MSAPVAARLATRLAEAMRPAGDVLVLAPHPDDETLGCGGAILAAREAGARVTIAFLTDGADSHSRFLPGAELAAIRREEAVAAAAVLGVEESDLRFLGYRDGRLADQEGRCREEIAELARVCRPWALFAPCPWDVSSDHLAASRIAASVAAEGPVLYGYATWFWDRWPWTGTRASTWPHTAARAALGDWRLLRRFRTRVDLGLRQERKRQALAQHRTQVERRGGEPAWPTLGDVSGGRWLELLLADTELFVDLSRRPDRAT
jgi:LmbE family N-acetylglucosaminyl deacetylase